jgi:hypothetical protein
VHDAKKKITGFSASGDVCASYLAGIKTAGDIISAVKVQIIDRGYLAADGTDLELGDWLLARDGKVVGTVRADAYDLESIFTL